MENNTEQHQAIFYQICEVNDLDPEEIKNQAGSGEEQSVETLIRAALDYRAQTLLHDVDDPNGSIKILYKIDPDPAAPSFMVNEDYIRKTYSEEEAETIIKALDQVKLPVQA